MTWSPDSPEGVSSEDQSTASLRKIKVDTMLRPTKVMAAPTSQMMPQSFGSGKSSPFHVDATTTSTRLDRPPHKVTCRAILPRLPPRPKTVVPCLRGFTTRQQKSGSCRSVRILRQETGLTASSPPGQSEHRYLLRRDDDETVVRLCRFCIPISRLCDINAAR
ncbi:hypothetical protein B0T16DRAFT_390794 [Cercophora newfieldiana]|uniref:Uncharacterized protein n=1 Tax=Cercophora newfieldiana TaxID=92897 RepID=A0AA39Y6M8_9PEZI|nr:hypothetical protein B0T16DRAFT_390794 [Cercophora newfieldiana]